MDVPREELEEDDEPTQMEQGSEDEGHAEDFAQLQISKGPTRKKSKTLNDRERAREALLDQYVEEFQRMRPESGGPGGEEPRPAPTQFPSMLRSAEQGPPADLPQPFLNQVWMRVLESDMLLSQVTEVDQPAMGVMEIEALARGIRPNERLPASPDIIYWDRLLRELVNPNGSYRIPAPEQFPEWRGEEGMDVLSRVRRRVQYYTAQKRLAVEADQDQAQQLRRRQGLAGIPELARVLATANPLWRRWWVRDFPRHARDMGFSAWTKQHVDVPAYLHESRGAPRPPSWILGMTRTEGLTAAEAGIEDQYAESPWRRYYAWTQFFERRCYRLIMEIAAARAADFAVQIPAFIPHGVFYSEPVRPDEWILESTESRQLGSPWFHFSATAVYGSADGNSNNDVEQDINLDAVACLTGDRDFTAKISAPLLAYLALRHAGDGNGQTTLMGPLTTFADFEQSTYGGRPYVYNFLDDDGPFEPLDTIEERLAKYQDILFSYILWSVVQVERQEAAGPPFEFGELLENVRQQAIIANLPVRLDLLEPLEQAMTLGLYVPSDQDDPSKEGHWPFLEALPVLPMRGLHGRTEGLGGNGGVRFVGKKLVV